LRREEEKKDAIFGEWFGKGMGQKWHLMVAASVAHLFSCRNAHRKYEGTHQCVGRPENIEACKETFIWICDQIEELYKEEGLKALIVWQSRRRSVKKCHGQPKKNTNKSNVAGRNF
jgi:hypothetical protein